MSSGFTSGGFADAPTERSDEWLAAQREIANLARKKQEASRAQDSGRSLYEALEANKAAKQDAFEEANRLKNQFRALDEDEIEFLDSVLEGTRAEDDRVKKETAEGLQAFRQQQEKADKKAREAGGVDATEDGTTAAEEEWVTTGRKRKRAKEKAGMKGVKIRRSSTATSDKTTPALANPEQEEDRVSEPVPTSFSSKDSKESSKTKSSVMAPQKTATPAKPSLVSYDSGEDDNW